MRHPERPGRCVTAAPIDSCMKSTDVACGVKQPDRAEPGHQNAALWVPGRTTSGLVVIKGELWKDMNFIIRMMGSEIGSGVQGTGFPCREGTRLVWGGNWARWDGARGEGTGLMRGGDAALREGTGLPHPVRTNGGGACREHAPPQVVGVPGQSPRNAQAPSG